MENSKQFWDRMRRDMHERFNREYKEETVDGVLKAWKYEPMIQCWRPMAPIMRNLKYNKGKWRPMTALEKRRKVARQLGRQWRQNPANRRYLLARMEQNNREVRENLRYGRRINKQVNWLINYGRDWDNWR